MWGRDLPAGGNISRQKPLHPPPDSHWPTWVQLPKHPLPAWSPAKLSDRLTLQEEGLALPWEFPDLQGLFLGH